MDGMRQYIQKINWEHIKFKLREAILTLPHFFKNPVQGMRNLPNWDWAEILILQAAFVAACSIVTNLIQRDILGLITGIVIAPVTAIVVAMILTALFYYMFQFALHRELPFRKIYMHVLFASIPTAAVSVVAFLIPPIMLVGVLASMLLLFVGFVSNFQLPARPVRNILGGLLALYALYWLVVLLNTTSKHKSMRLRATPESLDILEQELKSN